MDKPRVVFRSYVGRTKHLRVMAGGALEGSDEYAAPAVCPEHGSA